MHDNELTRTGEILSATEAAYAPNAIHIRARFRQDGMFEFDFGPTTIVMHIEGVFRQINVCAETIELVAHVSCQSQSVADTNLDQASAQAASRFIGTMLRPLFDLAEQELRKQSVVADYRRTI